MKAVAAHILVATICLVVPSIAAASATLMSPSDGEVATLNKKGQVTFGWSVPSTEGSIAMILSRSSVVSDHPPGMLDGRYWSTKLPLDLEAIAHTANSPRRSGSWYWQIVTRNKDDLFLGEDRYSSVQEVRIPYYFDFDYSYYYGSTSPIRLYPYRLSRIADIACVAKANGQKPVAFVIEVKRKGNVLYRKRGTSNVDFYDDSVGTGDVLLSTRMYRLKGVRPGARLQAVCTITSDGRRKKTQRNFRAP